MKRSHFRFMLAGGLAILTSMSAIASADDAKDKAIENDRKLLEGTWRIVALEVDGHKSKDEDARKFTVVNGADGKWSLRSEGKEIIKGTNAIDPTQKPKTIEITLTAGQDKGKSFLGIYELGEKTRKLCFAPAGKDRPTKFTSTPGNKHILVIFERDQIKQEAARTY